MRGGSQLAPYLVMQLAVQVSKLCTKVWNAMIGLMLKQFPQDRSYSVLASELTSHPSYMTANKPSLIYEILI